MSCLKKIVWGVTFLINFCFSVLLMNCPDQYLLTHFCILPDQYINSKDCAFYQTSWFPIEIWRSPSLDPECCVFFYCPFWHIFCKQISSGQARLSSSKASLWELWSFANNKRFFNLYRSIIIAYLIEQIKYDK